MCAHSCIAPEPSLLSRYHTVPHHNIPHCTTPNVMHTTIPHLSVPQEIRPYHTALSSHITPCHITLSNILYQWFLIRSWLQCGALVSLVGAVQLSLGHNGIGGGAPHQSQNPHLHLSHLPLSNLHQPTRKSGFCYKGRSGGKTRNRQHQYILYTMSYLLIFVV